jgi:hypothetical protein
VQRGRRAAWQARSATEVQFSQFQLARGISCPRTPDHCQLFTIGHAVSRKLRYREAGNAGDRFPALFFVMT